VAVVGPQGTGTGLFSDYYGDDICPGGSSGRAKAMDCVPTIAAAVAAANVGGTTTNATGVSIKGSASDPITMIKALAVARAADVVVLALGIDKTVEHEGVDRADIKLPGMQAAFAEAVYKLGKPVVLVLTNGGPLAIERARLCRDRSLLNGLGSAVVFNFFVMEALRKKNPSLRSARLTGQVLWAYTDKILILRLSYAFALVCARHHSDSHVGVVLQCTMVEVSLWHVYFA
jgi:hypothetical protein